MAVVAAVPPVLVMDLLILFVMVAVVAQVQLELMAVEAVEDLDPAVQELPP